MIDREADLAEIEAAVRTYLDAIHDGDADALARVFHPSSALTQSENGAIAITPRDVWLDRVRGRPSPRSQGLARHDRVLSIDLVGPTLAHVKVQCALPPRRFVDLLSFLKIDGRWQVAQKVFQTEFESA